MACGYNQIFTLQQIFNNKKLKGKLPLVNYREYVGKDGKPHKTTNMQTVTRLVDDTATRTARSFYKPLIHTKSGNEIHIDGNLLTDYDTAYEGIYQAIDGIKQLIRFTANNGEVIRSALKESVRIGKETGQEPKLYLRVGSMLEIEQMDKNQLRSLLNDIMKNIYYNDEYELVQEKFDLPNVRMFTNKPNTPYEQRKQKWERLTR